MPLNSSPARVRSNSAFPIAAVPAAIPLRYRPYHHIHRSAGHLPCRWNSKRQVGGVSVAPALSSTPGYQQHGSRADFQTALHHQNADRVVFWRWHPCLDVRGGERPSYRTRTAY